MRQRCHLRMIRDIRAHQRVFDQPVLILDRSVELRNERGRDPVLAGLDLDRIRHDGTFGFLHLGIDLEDRHPLAVDGDFDLLILQDACGSLEPMMFPVNQ